MSTYWYTLPHAWSIQNVQAAVNVSITFVCAGCVFIFGRHLWMSAARRAANNKEVLTHSLLNLNTISEVSDIVCLLRHNLFDVAYAGFLAQSVAVVVFTICTFGSGFIARVATHTDHVVIKQDVSVNLAGKWSRDTTDLFQLKLALEKIQSTSMPPNQLLDFWPDTSYDWAYDETRWTNASQPMGCRFENRLVPDVDVTGDCSGGYESASPFLETDWDDWPKTSDDGAGWKRMRGTSRTSEIDGSWVANYLLLDYGWKEVNTNSIRREDVVFRYVGRFMEGVPSNRSGDDCTKLATGSIQRVDQYQAKCTVSRSPHDTRSPDEQERWGANLLDYTLEEFGEAIMQFYIARYLTEQANNLNVTIINGSDFASFLQAYLITRNTADLLHDNRTTAAHVTRILDV